MVTTNLPVAAPNADADTREVLEHVRREIARTVREMVHEPERMIEWGGQPAGHVTTARLAQWACRLHVLARGLPVVDDPAAEIPAAFARSALEVQRAHDSLHLVLRGEVTVAISDSDRCRLAAMIDVLCWLLGHPHNDSFGINLGLVEEALAVAAAPAGEDGAR